MTAISPPINLLGTKDEPFPAMVREPSAPKIIQPVPRSRWVAAIDQTQLHGPVTSNDPIVTQFLTDTLGETISLARADEILQSISFVNLSGFFASRPTMYYGRDVVMWAAEKWHVLYMQGRLYLHCEDQPNNHDLEKLIFIVGWWTLRTKTTTHQKVWRKATFIDRTIKI